MRYVNPTALLSIATALNVYSPTLFSLDLFTVTTHGMVWSFTNLPISNNCTFCGVAGSAWTV